jgi:hypothetical protein
MFVFPCHQVISTSGACVAGTNIVVTDFPVLQHIAQLPIMAFAVPDIKIFVYVKSCMARITSPAMPMIEIVIV